MPPGKGVHSNVNRMGTISKVFPLLFKFVGFLRFYMEHSIITINVIEENPCSFWQSFLILFGYGSVPMSLAIL